jgi:hypothetical protein
MGGLDDRQETRVLEKIVELKVQSIANSRFEAVTSDTLTVDIPVPYNLKRLWFELLDPEIRTVTTAGDDVRAILEEGDLDEVHLGSASIAQEAGPLRLRDLAGEGPGEPLRPGEIGHLGMGVVHQVEPARRPAGRQLRHDEMPV